MRHRRWVLILAVIILGVIPAVMVALRVATQRPEVRSELLSRFVPPIDGTIDVGALELGGASIRFTDVRIELKNGSSVVIPAGSASVSYRRFATSGFEWQRSLSTLILEDPHVTVVLGGDEDDSDAAGDAIEDPAGVVERLTASLPGYLGVSDGAVTVVDAASGRSTGLRDIDILLERGTEGQLAGQATGSLLADGTNLTARVTLGEAGVSLVGHVEEARLAPDAYAPLPDAVELLAGVVSSGYHIELVPDGESAVRFDVNVRDVLLEVAGADTVSAVEGAFVYEDGLLRVRRLGGEWRGAALSVTGGEIDIAREVFRELSIAAEGIPAEMLSELGGSDLPELAGQLDVAARISGRLSAPTTSGTVESELLSVAGVPFRNVSATGWYSGSDAEIREARAAVLGGHLIATGSVSEDELTGEMHFELRGALESIDLSELGTVGWADALAGRASLSDVVVASRAGRQTAELLLSFDEVRYGEITLGSGAGGLLVRDETAYLTLSSPDIGYELSGELALEGDAQRIDGDVLLSGLRADALVAGPAGKYLPLRLDGPIHVTGELPEVDIDGIVGLTAEEAAATVRVTGRVRSAESGTELALSLASDDALARGVELPFAADLSVSPAALTLSRFEAAGFAEAAGTLTLGVRPTLRASAVLSGAPARSAFRLATGSPAPESLDGLAFMSGSVRGPLDALEGSGQLELARARIGDVTELGAVLVVGLNGRMVEVREATVEHAGHRILQADGSVELGGAIMMAVRGDGVPGPLLGGDERTAFSLAMGVGGTVDSPTFDCRVEAERGAFLGVPFDRFLARATGASGELSLDQLALERTGSYRVQAAGRAPLKALTDPAGPAEGELTIEIDDDPLALLAEISNVITEASGDGRAMLHFVGDRESLVLVRGDIEARGNSVRASDIFEELTDVEVSASIVDGSLVSGEVSALVQGRPVGITSRRSVLVDGRRVEPLVVGGVDVGVLALTTDPAGVELNVPGLMESGDVGRGALRGRGDVGAFLVAGPSEHPLLWGNATMSDMAFTYPFISSDSPTDNSFFGRAEWALTITAGRNLWYRRPDANLKIDRGTGLDFAGIPEDHTFCVAGRASSSRGTVTYLNADFDVRTAFIDFPSFCEPPRFYVEGTTRTNDGTEITLSVVAEELAGAALAGTGTPWDESTVLLRSDAPEDVTGEDVLARLTYGANRESLEEEDIATLERQQAIEVVASQVGVMIVRPLLAPVEGRLKRSLRLDLVRIDVEFVEHFLYQVDQWRAQEGEERYQPFLADSRLTLGKYVAHDWLLSYEASVEAYYEAVGKQSVGAQHEFGIEYEVSRNTSLSLKAVFDPALDGWDRRVSIENRFWF